MRSSWNDIISQHTLRIHSECTLRCIHCKLWEQHPLSDATTLTSHLEPLLENGTFFDVYPRTRVYNIVGGEPLIGPVIVSLLRTLKSAGVVVRVWTNGSILDAHWELLTPFIDEVVFYLPSVDPTEYRAITGTDHYESLMSRIDDLRTTQKKIKVSLNAYITPITVEWLPYFHDIARQHRLPLMITYYPSADFNPEEIEYIHRYDWVKHAFVFKLTKRHRMVCPGVPHSALQSPVTIATHYGKQIIDQLRDRFHL